MKYALIFTTAAFWFRHSLDRNIAFDYDFQLYLDGPVRADWFYPEYMTYVFEPLRHLPFDQAFLIYYLICTAAWMVIASRFKWAWVLTFYPALLILESANVTLILAALAITPLGAVLATLVKPYCAVFVLLHAVRAYYDSAQDRGWRPAA